MNPLSGSHPGRERVLNGEKAGWRQGVRSPCKSSVFLCTFLLFGLVGEG